MFTQLTKPCVFFENNNPKQNLLTCCVNKQHFPRWNLFEYSNLTKLIIRTLFWQRSKYIFNVICTQYQLVNRTIFAFRKIISLSKNLFDLWISTGSGKTLHVLEYKRINADPRDSLQKDYWEYCATNLLYAIKTCDEVLKSYKTNCFARKL